MAKKHSAAGKLAGTSHNSWRHFRRSVYVLTLIISVVFNVRGTVGKDKISPLFTTASSVPPTKKTPAQDRASLYVQQIEELKAKSIQVESLPTEVRGNGTSSDAVRLINEFVQAHNNSLATVESCIEHLDYCIEGRRAEINTLKIANAQSVEFRDSIRSLEMCMKVLGSYAGELDAKSSSLANAIIGYQKQKGLKPDGIVGTKTWLHIKADLRRVLSPPSAGS